MAAFSNIGSEAQFWWKVGATVQPKMQRYIEQEARELRDLFKEKSPVQTGRFKRSWRIKKRVNSSYPIIASVAIYNPIYSYGSAIEHGVDPESSPKHPWVKSAAQKEKSIVFAESSKVEEVKGKIYTKHAPGGIIDPTATPSYRRDLTRRVADQVIKIVNETK